MDTVSRYARAGASWAKGFKRLEMLIITRANRRRGFTLRGKTYSYCLARYNSTWHNERTVEVPIALDYLRHHAAAKVLEIGNVLSHYRTVHHDIVDKYEQAPGVLNVDVMDYQGADPYDLIVSVSTLEHVGWDEDVQDWTKPVRAVDHLRSLLSPEGTLLVTLPVGWNPHVDRALRDNAFNLDEVAYLKRISRRNQWREVAPADIGAVRYGRPFPAANLVAVGLANGS